MVVLAYRLNSRLQRSSVFPFSFLFPFSVNETESYSFDWIVIRDRNQQVLFVSKKILPQPISMCIYIYISCKKEKTVSVEFFIEKKRYIRIVIF